MEGTRDAISASSVVLQADRISRTIINEASAAIWSDYYN